MRLRRRRRGQLHESAPPTYRYISLLKSLNIAATHFVIRYIWVRVGGGRQRGSTLVSEYFKSDSGVRIFTRLA